jgi:hypothetical protein
LTIDVDEDIADLENQIAHTRMREKNALAALEFMDSDRTVGDESVLEAFNRAGFLSFFRHNRATMDDLLSTGNLSLLTDKELVRQVNNYYRATHFLAELDDLKKHWIWRGYRGSLHRHLPSRLFADLASGREPSTLGTVNWDSLRSDWNVRNGLGRVLGTAALERRDTERVLQRAKSLRRTLAGEPSTLDEGL